MLVLLPKIASINVNRTTVTVVDETVYGGTNPSRNDVGLYLIVQKMNSDLTVADTYPVTGNNGNPQTDTSWAFELLQDGWVRILMIAPTDYSPTETYNLYDVAQDPVSNIVYRSKQNGNIGNPLSDINYWEVVDATIALNKGLPNESTNVATTVFSVVLFPNLQYYFANAIAKASDYCCSDECTMDGMKDYIRMFTMLEGIQVRSTRAQYPQAERLVRRLESIIKYYI